MPLDLFVVLVFFLLIASSVAWWLFWRHAERKLLREPAPQAVLEVSVAGGVDKSTQIMTRLYRKLAGSLSSNTQSRLQGKRQMRIVLLASKPDQTTEVRCLVYADVERVDELKRFLKEDFEGQAAVVQLTEDPLKPAIRQLQMVLSS
jgi:hypothetical protein